MIFRHRHAHEAVAVQHKSPGPFQSAFADTVVLWRCPCGGVFSRQLTGRWTLAQVRGEREAAAAGQAGDAVPAEAEPAA